MPAGIPQKGKRFHVCVYGQHSLDGGERRHLRECIRQRGDRLWVLSVVGEVVVRKTAAQGTQKASKMETGGYHSCAHAHNRQARWHLLHTRNARLWQRLAQRVNGGCCERALAKKIDATEMGTSQPAA